MKIKILLTCVLVITFCNTAIADTIELVNGQQIEGALVGRDGDKVQFEVNGIVTTYDAKDVKSISIGQSEPQQEKKTESAPRPVEEKSSAKLSVPTGTILMVRTQQVLDSRTQGSGYKFTARLEEDLAVDGTVVAPKGSSIYGQIMSSKQAGRLLGKSEMTIAFTGLMINNQIRPIRSGEIGAAASSSSGRDTIGKTARGAVIGGLIDGSDGAKTGARVGIGLSVLTRGSRLQIPAGTLLEVQLIETLVP